ncbi:MAG TPA: acyl-ACP thioesterase domain-containing protein [Vitreimonas sp.]|nr:acyl-ACP thioesterase domain-containing protein [Vitreimonas sp.]
MTGEPTTTAWESGAAVLEHTEPYRIRFDEAGPDGLVRTSGLLRYAQDAGWQHSEARGLTRGWYAERGVAWVVRAAEIEVREAAPMGTTLSVTTRIVGYQRVWAQRRAECRLPDGRIAARIRTDWVLIDGRGRLVRVPPEITQRFPAPLLSEPLLRVVLPPTPDASHRRSFTVRPHELDPMNHPNNAVYVDWVEEGLLGSGREGGSVVATRPRTVRLDYAGAPPPGAEVTSATWPSGDAWATRLGIGESDLLRATVHG